MHNFFKIFSKPIIPCFLLAVLGINAPAQENPERNVSAKPAPPGRKSIITKEWKEGGYFDGFSPEDEIIEKRTQTTKHLKNKDGSKSAVTGGWFHYQDVNNSWQDIDFTIVKEFENGYEYLNKTHLIKTYYPNTPGSKGAKISLYDFDLKVWINPSMQTKDRKGNIVNSSSANPSLPVVSEDKIIYPSIYTGMDERFKVMRYGVESEIVINSLDPSFINNNIQKIEFSQTMELPPGYSVWKGNNQMYSDFKSSAFKIKKEGGEYPLTVLPIIIYDNKIDARKAKKLGMLKILKNKAPKKFKKLYKKLSNEDRILFQNSIAVSEYNVEFTGSGIKISYSVPVHWLASAQRVYPVIIDPVWTFTTYSGGWGEVPYDIYYNYARSQQIYLASELGANMDITKVEFKSDGASADQLNNSNERLADVAFSSFASSSWDPSGTVVYNGNLSVTSGAGYKGPALTTTFTHNNSFNLMFSYRHQDGSYESAYSLYEGGTPGTAPRLHAGASDSNNPPNTSSYDASGVCRITYNDPCGNSNCDAFETCATCPGDCGACTAKGNAYGIYMPAAQTGANITDCEIYAVGGTGTPAGQGYKVATPGDAGYTNVIVSGYPVINVDNTSCTSTNITHSTSASNPNFTNFGSNSSPSSDAIAPFVTQYTATGRKTVTMQYTIPPFQVTLMDENFEGSPTGWSNYYYTNNASNQWTIHTSCPISGSKSLQFKRNDCEYGWDVGSGDEIVYKQFNASGKTGLKMDFKWKGVAEGPSYDYGYVVYSTNGTTWNLVSATKYYNQSTTQSVVDLNLSALDNQATAYIGFRFLHDGAAGGDPAFVIDDINIEGTDPGSTTSKTYTGFNNIVITPPSSGSIISSATTACPGTQNALTFQSSLNGSLGFTYLWSVTNPAGGTSSITSSTSGSTDISFTNSTAGNLTFTINLAVTSECCGALSAPASVNITVYPNPAAPTVSASDPAPCTGSSVTLSGTAPAGSNYTWWDAATGGNLLGTGSSFIINPVASGTTTYYVESENSQGCPSVTRTSVNVTGNNVTPPVTSGGSVCGGGTITLSVTPVANATAYNWYSGSCGGTLLQSSLSTSMAVTVSSTTTYYVSVVTSGGCNESACNTVVATVNNSYPTSATWTGASSTDWFNTANWTLTGGTCVPNCNTAITIPNVATKPVIDASGFNPNNLPAEGGNITINSGSSLTINNKSELYVCGNFTHSGTLTMNGGKVSFNGSSQQTYSKTSTGSGDFLEVVINNSSGLKVLDGGTPASPYQDLSISASGQLNFTSGKILTEGGRSVVIKNTSSSAITGYGTSNYINGRFIQYVAAGSTYYFPVGNSEAYEQVSLKINSVSGGLTYLTTWFDNLSTWAGSGLPINADGAQYTTLINIGGPNSTTGIANCGMWVITPNAGSADYDMTVWGRNYDNQSGLGFTIMKRETYECVSTAWSVLGTLGSTTASGNVLTATRTGMSGFSKFAIGRSGFPLPVELLMFDGSCDPKNNSVTLTWVTASEKNNDYFTLERSCDGENYAVIGKIKGYGNSSSAKEYSFMDENFPGGNCTYRITQIDFDGASKRYDPIAVNCENNNEFGIVKIIPNPVKSDLFVFFRNDTEEPVYITAYDVVGQILISEKVISQEGLNRVALDLSNLSNGVYFITVNNTYKNFVERIVKQH